MSSSYESDRSEEIRMLQIKNQELENELNKLKAIPCDKCHLNETKYQNILIKFKELSMYFPKIVQFIQKHIHDNPKRYHAKSSSVLYDAINVKSSDTVAKNDNNNQKVDDLDAEIQKDIGIDDEIKQEEEKHEVEIQDQEKKEPEILQNNNIQNQAQNISENLKNDISSLQEIGKLKDQIIALHQKVGDQELEINKKEQLIDKLSVAKEILSSQIDENTEKQQTEFQKNIHMELKCKAAEAKAEYFEQLLAAQNAVNIQQNEQFLAKIAKLTRENVILSTKLKTAHQKIAQLSGNNLETMQNEEGDDLLEPVQSTYQ